MNNTLILEAINFLESPDSASYSELHPDTLNFLLDIGYLKRTKELYEIENNRIINIKFLRLFFKFESVFPLISTYAPRLLAFGGKVKINNTSLANNDGRLSSVSGAELGSSSALKACLGEAAERLSQYQDNGLSFCRHSDDKRKIINVGSSGQAENGSRFLSGQCLGTQSNILVRETDCIHTGLRDGEDPVTNSGCGAGVSLENAILHGLYELIERDAFALWWLGGRPGRPIELSSVGHHVAGQVLNHLRAGQTDRTCWLLDISTEFDVPCIAAVSTNRNGMGIAAGTSAGPNVEKAAQNALIEMCMMEMAYNIVDIKLRNKGLGALNPTDERHIRRAESLNAVQCALAIPQGIPRVEHNPISARTTSEEIQVVISRLNDHDISTYYVDLSAPGIDVPVAKCFSPELQTYPQGFCTARLKSCINEYGGGDLQHRGIMIY